MLDCRACALRCLRAIIADSPALRHSRTPLSQSWTPRYDTRSPYRRFTTNNVQKSTAASLATETQPLSDKLGPEKQAGGNSPRLSADEERALRTELQYLKDPVKLAQHVHHTLRSDKVTKALNLCRMAAKTKAMDSTVSWNHCVNYFVTKGKLSEAMKVYNEMKKRAVFPDSYTYTLLLRGFPATRTHHGASVKAEMVRRAMSIYDSMSSPTSRVKPSIIHTNAMLRICALAKDMDTLWTVVSKIPDEGIGCADYVTYTILLSAIRHNATDGDFDSAEKARRQQRAVDEGCRIWTEVIAKWRAGKILVDDELVAEMGNLLLSSSKLADWDAVLDLVQQTVNVERQIPAVGSSDRQTRHVPQEAAGETENGDENEASRNEDADGWTPTPVKDVFKSVDSIPVDPASVKKMPSLSWVKPGNATLSVVISACAQMRATKAVFAYWDKYVLEHGVQPDRGNVHALLDFLVLNRASAKAATLIRDVAAQGMELRTTTFRLAMSACRRDKRNPSMPAHAASIVDTMTAHLTPPDPATATLFLRLALNTGDAPTIAAAIDRLEPTLHVMHAELPFRSRAPQHVGAVVEVCKAVIGAIDVLTAQGTLEPSEAFRFRKRRYKLDAVVGRLVNREPMKGGIGVGEATEEVELEEEAAGRANNGKRQESPSRGSRAMGGMVRRVADGKEKSANRTPKPWPRREREGRDRSVSSSVL